MMRVLVMSESSLLADAIASNLAQDVNVRVLYLTQAHPGRLSMALREDCSVLLIIEEKDRTTSDLLHDYGCFRMITASPQKHHLHIYDNYEMPITRMPQAIHRAEGLKREDWSEVAK